MKGKWIVQVKGNPHTETMPASWEITVVRSDNIHGIKSWGWIDEHKLLVSHNGGPCHWPMAPGLGKKMIRIANDLCKNLNKKEFGP
jgi:hypothetical protein